MTDDFGEDDRVYDVEDVTTFSFTQDQWLVIAGRIGLLMIVMTVKYEEDAVHQCASGAVMSFMLHCTAVL